MIIITKHIDIMLVSTLHMIPTMSVYGFDTRFQMHVREDGYQMSKLCMYMWQGGYQISDTYVWSLDTRYPRCVWVSVCVCVCVCVWVGYHIPDVCGCGNSPYVPEVCVVDNIQSTFP